MSDGLRGRTILPVTPEQRAHADGLRSRMPFRQRKFCPHSVRVRGYIRKSNGGLLASAVCWACGDRSDIRKDDLEPLYDLCFADGTEKRACARCESMHGVELHHWAPRELFGWTAEDWPKSWLCPPCHREWHTIMRAGVPIPEARDHRGWSADTRNEIAE